MSRGMSDLPAEGAPSGPERAETDGGTLCAPRGRLGLAGSNTYFLDYRELESNILGTGQTWVPP